MKRTDAYFVFALFFLVPVSAGAQCKDQVCSSVENILDAAAVDLRALSHTDPLPDVSSESTKVLCSMSTWANKVPMLICYAQVPLCERAMSNETCCRSRDIGQFALKMK